MTGSETIRQAARELAREHRLFEGAKVGDPVVHCRRWHERGTHLPKIVRTRTFIRAIADGELFTVIDGGGVYRVADGKLDAVGASAWIEPMPRPAIPPEAAAVIEALRDLLSCPGSHILQENAEFRLLEYDASVR